MKLIRDASLGATIKFGFIPAVAKFLEDGANGDVVVELNTGTLGLKSKRLLARCPPALSVYSVVSRSILEIGTIGISDLYLSASYDATVYIHPQYRLQEHHIY